MLKKLITPLFTVMLIALCAVSVNAETATYKSTANNDSKKVTYTVTATATRTGETTAKVNWTVTPKWTDGAETKHKGSTDYPTKITGTITCSGQTKSFVLKKKGEKNLIEKSGSFEIAVKPKTTTSSITFIASGAGNYDTWHEETVSWYTYTTEHYYCEYAYSTRPNDYAGWKYCCGNGSHSYTGSRVGNSYKTISHYHEKTIIVTDKHPTNSGTIKKKKTLNITGMEKYYYLTYDSVGGTAPPAKQGFIGGNTIKISGAYPSYRYADAQLSAKARGWSLTRSTPGTGTINYYGGTTYGDRVDRTIYAVYPQRYAVSYNALGGSPVPATQWFLADGSINITSTTPLYWCPEIKKYGYTLKGWTTQAKTDPAAGTVQYRKGDLYKKNANMTLYAVAEPNLIGRVVYNKNCDDEAYNMPSPQNKYYNVPINLSNNVPYREDVTNKGQRRIFKYWNTKSDGTGLTFYAGDTFTLNANPHEPIPQDDINLYAIWFDADKTNEVIEEEANANSTPHIRYIEDGAENTLTPNSKWRSGERQTQLEDTLGKKKPSDVKRSYDSEGNLIKEN